MNHISLASLLGQSILSSPRSLELFHLSIALAVLGSISVSYYGYMLSLSSHGPYSHLHPMIPTEVVKVYTQAPVSMVINTGPVGLQLSEVPLILQVDS
jgi:hypothetical protein